MKALSEPEPLATTEPQPTAHIHVWVEETETIHHEAVTEEVWVVDAEAWDQPIYETVPTFTCACMARGKRMSEKNHKNFFIMKI